MSGNMKLEGGDVDPNIALQIAAMQRAIITGALKDAGITKPVEKPVQKPAVVIVAEPAQPATMPSGGSRVKEMFNSFMSKASSVLKSLINLPSTIGIGINKLLGREPEAETASKTINKIGVWDALSIRCKS